MRRFWSRLGAGWRRAALVGAMLAAVGCAGSTVSQRALMPAVESAWPAVRADLDLGLATVTDPATAAALTSQADALGDAVVEGDVTGYLGTWLNLRPFADRGVVERVSRGEIGPGVAASRLERITQFDAAMAEVTR